MELWVIWIIFTVIGSFVTGFVKSILGIEITSKIKFGDHIYAIVDTAISMFLGYLLMSAIKGHFLN